MMIDSKQELKLEVDSRALLRDKASLYVIALVGKMKAEDLVSSNHSLWQCHI
jgi:hypothetical protein